MRIVIHPQSGICSLSQRLWIVGYLFSAMLRESQQDLWDPRFISLTSFAMVDSISSTVSHRCLQWTGWLGQGLSQCDWEWADSFEIKMQASCPGTPHQDGAAERCVRTIKGRAQTVLMRVRRLAVDKAYVAYQLLHASVFITLVLDTWL